MKAKFYASFAALVIVLSAVLTLNVFNGKSLAALPRDCDDNAIIKCGTVNHAELKEKYTKNLSKDLKTIYSHYGISASMIAAGGQMGEAHKDGRITVGGKTVATGATSIGRQHISGSSKINIGGGTYYNSPNRTAFRSESIAAFVFFDKNGEFVAAILTSCGNPVKAVKVKVPPKKTPVYKCVSLTADKISRDTYSFKATAVAKDGATIVGYRYDFGDGESENKPVATVSHTYKKPGEYVAKLVVDVKVDGKIKQVTDLNCQVKVPVKEKAAYACESLSARLIKKEDRSYAFDLKYTTTGGASLQTVDFEFGDGQGREGVKPSELDTVTHAYPKDGNAYTAKAILHFATADDGETVQDDECTAAIPPAMCEQNPEYPIGDERCNPAPPVAELPKTGPMDLIGGGLGLGSLIAAGTYWYASRRGLLEAWLSR